MQVGFDKISVDIYFIKIKVLVDALSNCLYMIEPNSAWIEVDIITSAGDFEVSVLKIDFACDANKRNRG